ncbi:hypothetical protein BDN70DRAFT_827645 [Pholiota conissans]|uniref:Uncharacterized protein n=1 Tax=Pholiota conissans TaxID=109636 RepID=A0A9P5Z9M9_9AGAR|nr:hypothetical protein BDN70DRAFT_827645 [Pholiota conissans]
MSQHPPTEDGSSLDRSAKFASKWTKRDLLAFNIRVVDVPIARFFDLDTNINNDTTFLPPPSVSPTLLNNTDKPSHLTPAEYQNVDDRLFFRYLELVEHPVSVLPLTHVHDFTRHLLHLLGFVSRERMYREREKIPFVMCGERVSVTPDISLSDDIDYFLHIEEIKKTLSPDDLELRIIVSSIAAFHTSNIRRQEADLPTLESRWIPAVAMVGTAPTFYRTHVTQALIDAVVAGSYPDEETTVLRLTPVPDIDIASYRKEGMRRLDNRKIVFQCFEALKKFMVI